MPRTGYVNQIRTKLFKRGSEAPEMAHKQQIKRQVGV
jgi:hypothetical protein